MKFKALTCVLAFLAFSTASLETNAARPRLFTSGFHGKNPLCTLCKVFEGAEAVADLTAGFALSSVIALAGSQFLLLPIGAMFLANDADYWDMYYRTTVPLVVASLGSIALIIGGGIAGEAMKHYYHQNP